MNTGTIINITLIVFWITAISWLIFPLFKKRKEE